MIKNEYRLRFILVFTAISLILFISNIWYVKKDMSKEALYTLSDYTNQVLNELDEKVQIYWFRSSRLSSYSHDGGYILDILSLFEEHESGKCIVRLYNADDIDEQKLISLGFVSQSVETNISHSKSKDTIYSGLLVEFRGRYKSLPFVASIANLEYKIVSFILQINMESIKKSRNISLVLGSSLFDIERIKEDRKPYIVEWLEYEGFNVKLLDLPLQEELDIESPLFVLGSSDIDDSSLSIIDIFLKNKGVAAFFVSGNTIDVKGDWSVNKKEGDLLIEFLLNIGFEVEHNLVLDIANFPLKMLREDGRGSKTVNYPLWPILLQENMKQDNLLFYGSGRLQCFWPSSIKLDKTKNNTLEELATSSEKGITIDKDYNVDPFSNLLSLFDEREKGKRCIIAKCEKPSRILVISDENMIGDAIEYTDSTDNLDFALNIAFYLAKKDNLLRLKAKKPRVLPFRFYDDDIFNFIILKARILCFLIVPAIILVLYIGMRKRKNDKS